MDPVTAGLSLVQTVVSEIARARSASAEESAAIAKRFQDSEAALLGAQAAARAQIAADTQATQDELTKP